ncbi:MAG: hypothetical protein FWD71_11230 [Oscillospiraceae bacterium]|nr:hypothetical protein [Oscillospiraceae bacterium]
MNKRKARKILEETYQIAYNATLTGAMRDGASILRETYNKIRESSIQNGWIKDDFTFELEDNVNMASVGVAAKLLCALLEDEYDENGFKIKEEENE